MLVPRRVIWRKVWTSNQVSVYGYCQYSVNIHMHVPVKIWCIDQNERKITSSSPAKTQEPKKYSSAVLCFNPASMKLIVPPKQQWNIGPHLLKYLCNLTYCSPTALIWGCPPVRQVQFYQKTKASKKPGLSLQAQFPWQKQIIYCYEKNPIVSCENESEWHHGIMQPWHKLVVQ